MVFFGSLAWWCVDLRVLPRNPYPIASAMALFAGSLLIGTQNQIQSSNEEQQLLKTYPRKASMFITQGQTFRLGWWKYANTEEDNTYENNSIPQCISMSGKKRFGIDVEP
ncbi:hypothetical protein GGR57DRAFT_517661 [Xylariaceae sp. FL1272]|nr:hypothetical protein GGR57DRAFT_517661 [Xylariaceae sp. FL1272]